MVFLPIVSPDVFFLQSPFHTVALHSCRAQGGGSERGLIYLVDRYAGFDIPELDR